MDKDLIIGLCLVLFLFISQIILVIYNRHIVEVIHNNKLKDIKEIKNKFFQKK